MALWRVVLARFVLFIRPKRFQQTNVRMIKEEARTAMRNLKYGGDTRSWNYEKYVRGWKKNIDTLREFDDCPREETLVSDFCSGITDPRLDAACANVLQEGSPYLDNFDKTQRYFLTMLAVSERRDKNRPSPRNVSTAATQTPKRFTGPLEAKSYTHREWGMMDNSQRGWIYKCG